MIEPRCTAHHDRPEGAPARWAAALWRRVVVAAAACGTAIAAGCASAGAPPGGPPDEAAPKVLKVLPKTMTIDPKVKELEIVFDEVISETPKSTPNIATLVFISPRVKEAQIGWHRDRLTIKPKGGWKPNTTYSIQISSGLQDLRANALDTAITVVFSTGGAIPTTSIVGLAFDWVAGRVANKALVEAIAKDSTIYQVLSDSIGRFTLKHVPIGEYAVRAIVDRNNNRLLDPTEAFDTVRIALTSRSDVELYAFPHDTVGLRIAEVTASPSDSLRVLKVRFDKPLSPDQRLTTPQFTLKRADSTGINVVLVQTAAERARFDSLARKAREDSVTASRPRDTSAVARAREDSAAQRKRVDSVAAAERAAREARRLAALRGGRPIPVVDTTPLPKMKRPAVSAEIFITVETPLAPGAPYVLQAFGVKSLSGTNKSPSRAFVTPRAEKKDSAAAPVRKPPQ